MKALLALAVLGGVGDVPAAASHDIYIWTSGGCGNPSPGAAPVTGEKVRLAWVDTGGRLGALSPIVTVHADKTP